MKKIIRLTESDLNNIIKEAISTILQEDGEIGGGGATNCVGINVGGAAGQANNHIDAAPFSNKPLKQKHNLGNPTTKKANMVDITPALDRTPGFSMGERVGGKKKVDEAVNESIGNWLKTAALGGMMTMSPMQANAQTQNYERNDSTESTMQQRSKMTLEQLIKIFPKAYKDRNANPKVWERNQKQYVAEVNGKISLVGKIAASHGKNPWDAIVKRYCPQEDNTFQLGDFDI